MPDMAAKTKTKGFKWERKHLLGLRELSAKEIAHILDTAAGFERQSGFMHALQDIVHGVRDRARNGAVDSRSGRFVFMRTGIGGNPPGRNGTVAQRPKELFVPVRLLVRTQLDLSQGPCHTLVGIIDGLIHRDTVLAFQAILLVPDILRCILQRNSGNTGRD